MRWTADGSALIGVANQELDLSIRRYPVGGGDARLVRRLPEAMDAVLTVMVRASPRSTTTVCAGRAA